MDDRISGLESAVEHLRLTVVSLQQRLDVIDARGLSSAGAAVETIATNPPGVGPGVEPIRSRAKDPYDPVAILSLVGRLFLVLAGGFFLRAMTDAGVLAVPVGIALAFAYALLWLFLGDRAGRSGLVPNAVVHALATSLIAFPLAVEATIRFKVLPGSLSALVVTAVSAGLLFVAWRGRIRGIAWIAVVGALPTSAALLAQTGIVAPFAVFLIAFGVATLWLGYSIDWWGVRWPVALAADLAVAGVTLRALAPEHRDAPEVAMLLQLLLLVGYFGSIAIRTLLRGRNVSPFEAVQTAAALVVGLGGAVLMARATDSVPGVFGAAALVVGALCYGVAIAVVARREASALNLYFYTTLALALVLAGFSITIEGVWLGAVFALFAVLTSGRWARSGQLFMLLHGAVYIAAAGIACGSLAYSARTLLAGEQGPWALPEAAMLIVLVASVLTAGLAAARLAPDRDELPIGARFVIIIVVVWTAGGIVIGYLAPLAGGLADRSVDPGVLATVSTGVLSAGTLLVAWVGRQPRYREWGWLVYPLLVGIGIKLVTQDFKHSRPATLFIAMALYGAALIVAPRLRRRAEKVTAQVDA